MDYKRLFLKTMLDSLERIYDEHGIEYITEDELENTISSLTDAYYVETIQELRKTHGLMTFEARPSGLFGAGSVGRALAGPVSAMGKPRRGG